MTTGEGGMIVTDDDTIADKARLLRDHGQVAKYQHALLGYNYRMTEIAAAIGLVQLKKLDGWVKQRRANAQSLTKGLQEIEGLKPPAEGNWMVHSYYQYIVRREDAFPVARDEIVRILNEEGIGCRPSYPMPLYKQKALQDLRIRGRGGPHPAALRTPRSSRGRSAGYRSDPRSNRTPRSVPVGRRKGPSGAV